MRLGWAHGDAEIFTSDEAMKMFDLSGKRALVTGSSQGIGLALAVGVAAVAIGWGVLRHRRMLPFVVAMTGLVLMAAALVVRHGADELMLTLAGVAIVSLGHVLNLRAAR